MNATDTVTTATSTDHSPKYATIPDTWLKCAICGIASNRLFYAHNTCSQLCACTAAICERVRELTIALLALKDRRTVTGTIMPQAEEKPGSAFAGLQWDEQAH